MLGRNEYKMNKYSRIVASVSIPALIAVAFYGGGRFKAKTYEKSLESLSETMGYIDSIENAANYGQILLRVRAGETDEAIRQLEKITDASLLMASGRTNAVVRPITRGPWFQLKKDRADHPRQTTAARNARITTVLETLEKE